MYYTNRKVAFFEKIYQILTLTDIRDFFYLKISCFKLRGHVNLLGLSPTLKEQSCKKCLDVFAYPKAIF